MLKAFMLFFWYFSKCAPPSHTSLEFACHADECGHIFRLSSLRLPVLTWLDYVTACGPAHTRWPLILLFMTLILGTANAWYK